MSIKCGHWGSIALSGGTSPIPDTAHITWWNLRIIRKMVDVTPKNNNFRLLWPSHGDSILDVRGYIDQATAPGIFDAPGDGVGYGPFTITLRPSATDTNKKIVFVGRLEWVNWQVGIDMPNEYTCRFLGSSDDGSSDDPTQTWT